MEDIWFSPTYQLIRQKMIKGETISACRLCDNKESIGGISKRLRENEKYKEQVQAVQAEQSPSPLPTYLDLRFGNKCNLKCRMCNPTSSSLIREEVLNKWSRDSAYFKKYSKLALSKPENQQWYQSDSFLENLNKLLPKLERVYFTGGEPTINPEFYHFLNRCTKGDFAKNIELVIITNFTSIKDEFFRALKNFKKVLLLLSIDAIGRRANYIRHPSKWERIEANLLKLFPISPNVIVQVTCTVSVLNIFYLDELFDYFTSFRSKYEQEIPIDINLLYNPHHLKVSILPSYFKDLALEKIKNIIAKYPLLQREERGLEDLTNLLFSEEENTKQLSIFKEYTLELDNIRNENFSGLFGELKELL